VSLVYEPPAGVCITDSYTKHLSVNKQTSRDQQRQNQIRHKEM